MIGVARAALMAVAAPVALAAALTMAAPAAAGEYAGPLIDAHSHVPNATAIDAYVAAMKRHGVTRSEERRVGKECRL